MKEHLLSKLFQLDLYQVFWLAYGWLPIYLSKRIFCGYFKAPTLILLLQYIYFYIGDVALYINDKVFILLQLGMLYATLYGIWLGSLFSDSNVKKVGVFFCAPIEGRRLFVLSLFMVILGVVLEKLISTGIFANYNVVIGIGSIGMILAAKKRAVWATLVISMLVLVSARHVAAEVLIGAIILLFQFQNSNDGRGVYKKRIVYTLLVSLVFLGIMYVGQVLKNQYYGTGSVGMDWMIEKLARRTIFIGAETQHFIFSELINYPSDINSLQSFKRLNNILYPDDPIKSIGYEICTGVTGGLGCYDPPGWFGIISIDFGVITALLSMVALGWGATLSYLRFVQRGLSVYESIWIILILVYFIRSVAYTPMGIIINIFWLTFFVYILKLAMEMSLFYNKRIILP